MSAMPITVTPRRARVGALLAAGAIAATLVVAGPADAEPKSGAGGAKGCPVENSNGTTSTVPVGTQIGLFRCGRDGDWHFGWFTTDRVKSRDQVKSPGRVPAKPRPPATARTMG